jgi:hypothetical protein
MLGSARLGGPEGFVPVAPANIGHRDSDRNVRHYYC